jgi:Na+-translocating ferredoxin:NAD+ oxidoreductase RNF subunit RnfB
MILDMILKSLIGILVFTVFSFLCALLLSFLSRLFQTTPDKEIDRIMRHLPGLDCGECGYPNCSEYAYKVAHHEEDFDKCLPGNKEILRKIRNRNLKSGTSGMVAKIACLSTNNFSDTEYVFDGADDCFTLYNHFSGDKKCKFGCMGRGDCQKICPMNAIKTDSQGRFWIDSGICSGCGKCVSICPTSVIKLVPLSGGHFVACSNHENEEAVKDECKWGCTGCKSCELFSSAVRVKDNLAVISYDEKMPDLQNVASKCPAKVIVPIKGQKAYLFSLKENN